jgi:hypothetical protein
VCVLILFGDKVCNTFVTPRNTFKFVGGPGTPGVLVVKKQLLCNRVPSTPGGGTVFFVTEDSHRCVLMLCSALL